MSVLNKISKESRKKLNRCIKDRPIYLCGSPTVEEKKTLTFYFHSLCGEFRNFKRILAALYYLTSREKTKNKKEFKIDISCLRDSQNIVKYAENIEDIIVLSNEIESNEIFSSSNLISLKKLSKIFNPPFDLFFFFFNGNFDKDEPQNINDGKIFTSEECLICLEKTQDIHFVDCGHICVCNDCFRNINNITNFGVKCSLCKTENNIIRRI